MKTIISRLLVSFRLDNDRAAGRVRVENDEPSTEAAEFESRCVDLDRKLKAGVPQSVMPAELHARIMHQVRALERTRRLNVQLSWWAASALLVIAVVLSAQWYPRTQRVSTAAPPSSLVGLSVAFERASRLPLESPKAFVSPLANELELLNADLRGAAGVLLASLPSAGSAISIQP
jgi:hypothetical protein